VTIDPREVECWRIRILLVPPCSTGLVLQGFAEPGDRDLVSDASSEPGNVIVVILFNKAPAQKGGGYDYPE
jgi:hypothetical protein